MKEKYVEVKLEIIELKSSDIIITSEPQNYGDNYEPSKNITEIL